LALYNGLRKEAGFPLISAEDWKLKDVLQQAWNFACTEARRRCLKTTGKNDEPRVVAEYPEFGPGAQFFRWNEKNSVFGDRNAKDPWYKKFSFPHENMDEFFRRASQMIPVNNVYE
jgi:hypothetical protein